MTDRARSAGLLAAAAAVVSLVWAAGWIAAPSLVPADARLNADLAVWRCRPMPPGSAGEELREGLR